MAFSILSKRMLENESIKRIVDKLDPWDKKIFTFDDEKKF